MQVIRSPLHSSVGSSFDSPLGPWQLEALLLSPSSAAAENSAQGSQGCNKKSRLQHAAYCKTVRERTAGLSLRLCGTNEFLQHRVGTLQDATRHRRAQSVLDKRQAWRHGKVKHMCPWKQLLLNACAEAGGNTKADKGKLLGSRMEALDGSRGKSGLSSGMIQ